MERDSNDTSLLSMPGKWIPAACTRYPVVANMATLECLSSAARNQANVESDPLVARLQGSNAPSGRVFPGKSSRGPSRSEEEHVCTFDKKVP